MSKPLAMILATMVACGRAGAVDAIWTPGPDMPAARSDHQALPLGDGGAMVVGGLDAGGSSERTALVADPHLSGWTVSRTFDRVDVRACVLASGRVLVTGGRYADAGDAKSAVCELYDPVTGTWSPTGSLHVGRYLHVVEPLPDGGAVVIGGISDATDPMDPGSDHIAYENPIERYDPVSRMWTASSVIAPGARSASAALADGRVLAMGGFRGMDSGSLNQGGWLYDPADGSAIVAAAWTGSAYWVDFALTALPDGRALRAGGIAHYDPDGASTATAEFFDPSANAWTPTGTLPHARAGHALAALADGHAVDADGADTAVYDPAAGSWTPAPARPLATTSGTLTRLHDGRLLAIGGTHEAMATATTWILGPPATIDPTSPSAGASAPGSGPSDPVPASASVGDSGHGCGMGGAIAMIAMAIASGLRTRRIGRCD